MIGLGQRSIVTQRKNGVAAREKIKNGLPQTAKKHAINAENMEMGKK